MSTDIDNFPFTTEDMVIHHVQKTAQYHAALSEPYCVRWKGNIYSSKDTRNLVVQICQAEGIPLTS